MAIVNGSLQLGYKDSTWFAANPTLVLKEGQAVFLEQTGTYKLGDGTSQLSALTFLGGANSSVDGLQSGGTITIVGNDIQVAAATWLINPTIYLTASTTTFASIALSSAGLQRYIGLYGTTSNTIIKVDGSEAALATYPTTPANSIVIGYVLVNDASASTTPDLSGYLLKLDKATQSTNITGTNDTTYVTPLANAVKQNVLVSGTNIKTVNGTSLLGSGNITITGGTGTILGTLAATSGLIPYSTGTLDTIQGSTNFTYDGTNFIAKPSTLITHQIGTTSTNAMYRLDSIGFRVGTVATIGTANTAKFEVDGAAIITSNNVKYGIEALNSLTSGVQNIGIGYQSGNSVTTTSNNVTIGYLAGKLLTSSDNVAIGTSALSTLVSNGANVAIGTDASKYIKSTSNVSIGYQSLFGHVTNTTIVAQRNTTVGYRSMYSITTGSDSTAYGFNALYTNTSGTQNTALGLQSLYYNLTGSNSTAIGFNALQSNVSGNRLIALGNNAGFYETASDALYIHNGLGVTNLATGKTNSIIYGQMNATNTLQRLNLNASVMCGVASPSTTATDGFTYIPACAGTPTGVPTAQTGFCPIVIDSTNNKMYIYSGGSWVALN